MLAKTLSLLKRAKGLLEAMEGVQQEEPFPNIRSPVLWVLLNHVVENLQSLLVPTQFHKALGLMKALIRGKGVRASWRRGLWEIRGRCVFIDFVDARCSEQGPA